MTLAAAAVAAAEPVTIHCPTEPPQVRTYDLVERWHQGGDDPDAPLMGWAGSESVVARDGRIYMLDRQLCHVLVFADDGTLLDTLSGEGEGPGEVRMPSTLLLFDGDQLAIKHGFPSRLARLALDGTPRGEWRCAANAMVSKIRWSPAGWVASYSEADFSAGSREQSVHPCFVSLLDADGERVHNYLQATITRDHVNPSYDERADYFPYGNWDVTPDGLLVIAPERDRYRLEWRTLDGDLVRTAERDVEPRKRTDADLETLRERNSEHGPNGTNAIPCKLESCDPVIRSITVQPDGSIYVATPWTRQDLPEGVVTRYDVHDPDGRLREHMVVRGDYDLEQDGITILGDGRAVVMLNMQAAFRLANERGLPEDLKRTVDTERETQAFALVLCDLVPVP